MKRFSRTRPRPLAARAGLLAMLFVLSASGTTTVGQQRRPTETKAQSKPQSKPASKHAGPKKFFVIAPEAFHPALAEYIEYKRRSAPRC